MMRTRSGFLIPLALLLASGPARALSEPPAPSIPVEARKKAPKLSLRDMDGQKRQLADLKGKVVVVNFWATWCGPCVREMPEFTRVYAAYQDRGVEMIGAANEPRSERDNVQGFVQRLGITFPIWLEASLDHMEAFGVGPELPATVIVDTHGRLAARIKGVTHEAHLRGLLDPILAEPAASASAAQPSSGR
ncbi:MAG: TlpA family protein disulfide reductase [Solirubrobacteraceae bacterium]|nr:TlpA family protein disulfide reductase [Solirubrobacteraceae bacterium]